MKRERIHRWKQYGIWFRLLVKRLLKQPAFVGLLALIPLLGYGVGVLEQEPAAGAVVAVCVEEGEWSEEILSGLKALSAENPESVSVLRYVFYESDAQTRQAVVSSEADCGFVIGKDIARRIKEGEWQDSIKVYETSASSITGMAQERVAGVLFRLYSENGYWEYLEDLADREGLAREYQTEELLSFARQAYETHLVDGSTFSFLYRDDLDGQYNNDTSVGNDTAVFPVKGVFAVLIFISGMCGMLEYEKDQREKRFLRLAPNWLTYIVNIWVPTILTSLAVLCCLWLTDALRYSAADGTAGMAEAALRVWSPGVWRREAAHLILYQGMIICYCGILRVFLRRQETIAAAIPILTLGSLVCAPVFIRLASYAPLFAALEKLFPAAYYLAL